MESADTRTQERIHLIGVCGTGMAGLACMLKELGHSVSGSDENTYPPMSTLLDRADIKVVPFSERNATSSVDRFVVSASIPARNAEVAAAIASGVPVLSLPEALDRYVLEGRDVHLVSGTHGKTTTAALLTWIHQQAGNRPGYFIGGAPLNFATSASLPKGQVVVIEGDEYKSSFRDRRPKFTKYRPHIAAITNIEFDHGDVFPDFDAVLSAFCELAGNITADGALVTSASPDVVPALRGAAHCQVFTVSRAPDADWLVKDRPVGPGSVVEVVARKSDAMLGPFTLKVPGRHNVENASLAAVSAHIAGVETEVIHRSMATFLGVERRLQVVADGSVRLIDDFAHHPSEVRASILALRQHNNGRRIWAIFEPRSVTSKTPRFHDMYRDALVLADRATILEVPQRDDGRATLDVKSLSRAIQSSGTPASSAADPDAVATEVALGLTQHLDILVMSHGPFGGLLGLLQRIIADHQG